MVALGEGLETQYWRVDQGTVQWVSVDLPEAIALRRELLPSEPRVRLVACSALDERWVDEVDTAAPVLVTAEGLLMYLSRDEVHRLLATCAARIPTGGVVFDAVSPRLRDRSARAARADEDGYRPPRWTWAIDRDERRVIRAIPNLADLETLRLPAWPRTRLRIPGAAGPGALAAAPRAALDHARPAGRSAQVVGAAVELLGRAHGRDVVARGVEPQLHRMAGRRLRDPAVDVGLTGVVGRQGQVARVGRPAYLCCRWARYQQP